MSSGVQDSAFELALQQHGAGRLAEAEELYRRALAEQPSHARATELLGVLCFQTDRFREAVELLERAIAINPNSATARCNYGMVLSRLCRFSDAIKQLRAALAIQPNFPEAYNNLANALRGMGQIEEAIDCLQRGLSLKSDPNIAGNLLSLLHYHPGYDARRLFQAHAAWARAYAEPLKRLIVPHANDSSPSRRLRIGYVAPDMMSHPVSWFLIPLLENHDRERFEIFCYSDTVCPDDVTAQIRRCCDGWRITRDLSDQQTADLVRQDRIDILVDLAMHTDRNRLLMFAQKPAPVQVTYLAYCGTTGLDTIDYRFTDPYLDPPGSDESVYSEKSVRLETFWCYRAPPEAPAVGPLPATSAGFITFGCLNNYAKVTRQTLDLWATLLRQVEKSRLMIFCAHGEARGRTIAHMSRQGIEPGRLVFVPPQTLPAYYGQYNQIDIALDPFPYPGGTTTCDALWMGVPVVSLAGQTGVSRGGASILGNLGLGELVSREPEQYLRLASELAADTGRLANLRATLRDRMRSSPLMDAPRFACRVETAYCAMWQAWCDARR